MENLLFCVKIAGWPIEKVIGHRYNIGKLSVEAVETGLPNMRDTE